MKMVVKCLTTLGMWKLPHAKQLSEEKGRTVILAFVFVLLQHRFFQAASAVKQSALEVHQKPDTVSAITKFVASESIGSKDLQGDKQEEGFTFPSSLRTLDVEGPALRRCKSACSLMVQAINDEEQIVAGMASQNVQLQSRRLKHLMIFPDLNVGKYRLWTNCAQKDNLECYSDPCEMLFEVAADDFEKGNIIHIGKLTILARPSRRVTDSQLDSIRQSRLSYAWSLERWRGVSVIATVFVFVGAGLLLISFFTNEDHR